jgi:hypothetical protein
MTQLAPKTSEYGPIQGAQLREVTGADLATIFEQEQASAANQMGAFTAKDPASQARVCASPFECRSEPARNRYGSKMAGNVNVARSGSSH